MPGERDNVSFSYILDQASLHSSTMPSAVEISAAVAKEGRMGQELQTIFQIA